MCLEIVLNENPFLLCASLFCAAFFLFTKRKKRQEKRLVPSAVAVHQHEESEEGEEGTEGRQHVGPGGGPQDLLGAGAVGVIDVSAAVQELQPPLAGVELHGQGHQLEQEHGPVEGQADDRQGVEVHEQADEDHVGPHGGADVGHGKHGRAPLDGRVVLLVLEHVADLVGCDGQGGHGVGVIDIRRQAHGVVPGVVVVGEGPLDRLDGDAAAVIEEHLLGRLVRRDAPGSGDGVVTIEDPPHLALGDQAQDEDHDQGQHQGLIADVDAENAHGESLLPCSMATVYHLRREFTIAHWKFCDILRRNFCEM